MPGEEVRVSHRLFTISLDGLSQRGTTRSLRSDCHDVQAEISNSEGCKMSSCITQG